MTKKVIGRNFEQDIFIFTEAFGCGEILKPMLNSYLAHHQNPIHVFGFAEDLTEIDSDPRIRPIVVGDSETFGVSRGLLEEKYRSGHGGTAYFWSRLFMNLRRRKVNYVVHFDSDVIFLEDVYTTIEDKLLKGYEAAGPRRRYRHSSAPRSIFRQFVHWFLPDVIDTHSFGINLSKIALDEIILERYINGGTSNRFKQRLLPVIDFFDRVIFEYISSSKIFYIDSRSQIKHQKKNKHEQENLLKNSLIVFSAVGSGCVFSKSKYVNHEQPYTKFALSSYYLYANHFLGKNYAKSSLLSDATLEMKLMELDMNTWSLVRS